MKDIITGILLLFTTASCIYFWEYILTYTIKKERNKK